MTRGSRLPPSAGRWGALDCQVRISPCSGSRAGAACSESISWQQDIVYVGGGSMVNMLAVWRAHGIDRLLREAWQAGRCYAVRARGRCAGSSGASRRSTGVARPARGLGLLPGTLSVHHHRDPDRRRALLQAVSLVIPPGYGVDDQAGLLFRGSELADAGQRQARGGRVAGRERRRGRLDETQLATRALADPRSAIDEPMRTWPSYGAPSRHGRGRVGASSAAGSAR